MFVGEPGNFRSERMTGTGMTYGRMRNEFAPNLLVRSLSWIFHQDARKEFAMPIHDWTRVRANLFHDFHQSWTIAIRNVLNAGQLPPGYFAIVEPLASSARGGFSVDLQPRKTRFV